MTGPDRPLVRTASRKQRKAAKFIHRLTRWPLDDCIEFAVLFEWQIAQAGGADKLLATWRQEWQIHR